MLNGGQPTTAGRMIALPVHASHHGINAGYGGDHVGDHATFGHRGELGCHAVSDGGTRPFRAHFRDPSFTNLQSLAAMTEGGMVADVIAAVASIDPVMGGVDR